MLQLLRMASYKGQLMQRPPPHIDTSLRAKRRTFQLYGRSSPSADPDFQSKVRLGFPSTPPRTTEKDYGINPFHHIDSKTLTLALYAITTAY